ncbi:sugar phosphate isomerase/epimerase family protein [Cohnella fermenti]|uniref:Sugar phosphate isomerase/epimerase n=1 Tax=Cohnella fermenti TaxID=2565925 RepID=A0A4S4BWV8_9BACL|nr:sugar phosphate isomerase/epimerase [Cohnella fermenti]THF79123.1 sugar phosphate isomerase/epimerase [Cohnella fermenti]
MRSKLAVQLFTVREACASDMANALERLKGMGWSGVQFAGLHGWSAARLADKLRDLELRAAGLHYGYAPLLAGLEQHIEDAIALGTRDLVCSSIPIEMRTEDGYREVRKELAQAAQHASKRGVRISYHNHAYEFEQEVDGMDGLSYLLEPSAGHAVLAEPDVYWIFRGGMPLLPFLERYADRVPLIHLKDMTSDEKATFAPVGTGRIDFAPIAEWGERSGVEWYVVEQDRCEGDPFDALQTSYTNLQRIIASMEDGTIN